MLFYGYACASDITSTFSYQKISKWELMHQNYDFTTHIADIFFKVVKIILEQISSLVWVCIRKTKLKGKKLLGKDV